MIKFTLHALLHSNRIPWIFFVNPDLNKNSRHFYSITNIFANHKFCVFLFDIIEVCQFDSRQKLFQVYHRTATSHYQNQRWTSSLFHKASPDHDLTLQIYSLIWMSGWHDNIDKDITQGHSRGIFSPRHHALAPIGTKSSAMPILTSQWPRCLIRCTSHYIH